MENKKVITFKRTLFPLGDTERAISWSVADAVENNKPKDKYREKKYYII
jgi:hypothetical protein